MNLPLLTEPESGSASEVHPLCMNQLPDRDHEGESDSKEEISPRLLNLDW